MPFVYKLYDNVADVLKATAEQKLRALEAVGIQAEGDVKDEIIEANNRIKKSAYSDDRRRLIFTAAVKTPLSVKNKIDEQTQQRAAERRQHGGERRPCPAAGLFFMERSVVEHGQCISVNTMTHAAVFPVQPLASNIPLMAAAESVRLSAPSAI